MTQALWDRFLRGKTGVQRFVLAVGGLAGAVLAIAGVVAGGMKLLDDRDSRRVGPAGRDVQVVRNQSMQADEFVTFLLDADGAAVQLNHQVLSPRGPGGEFRLEYNCDASTRCSFVRLETPSDIAATIAGGVWYQGCWSVTREGAGFGADHLDIELRKQGEECPR